VLVWASRVGDLFSLRACFLTRFPKQSEGEGGGGRRGLWGLFRICVCTRMHGIGAVSSSSKDYYGCCRFTSLERTFNFHTSGSRV
jgi:hypothetical protein